MTKSYGPVQYVSLPMSQLTNESKMVLNYEHYQGVYICSQFRFKTTMTLPSNAVYVKVLAVDPSGFKDLTSFEKGTNYTMSVMDDGSINLTLWYYTVRIEYDLAGRSINTVIPVDGRTIKVPYKIYYED